MKTDFEDILNYFGGNLGKSRSINEYLDVEAFFLESTLHLNEHSRLTLCILNWIYFYGTLLSPSKLRRMIKNGSEYEPKGLGVLFEFGVKQKIFKSNFEILNPYCKKGVFFAHAKEL